jgi:hypothetical protein
MDVLVNKLFLYLGPLQKGMNAVYYVKINIKNIASRLFLFKFWFSCKLCDFNIVSL